MNAANRWTNLFYVAALFVASVLITGCDKDKGPKLLFSHNLHVQENGMSCTDCHGKVKDGRFAAAGHEACKECHEEWMDQKAIGEKTCGKCHKVKNLKYELAAMTAAPDKMPVSRETEVFVHTAALTNLCRECHGTLLNKSLTSVPAMSRDMKIQMRDSAHRSGKSCATCHTDMDPRTPPPSHKLNWTKRHGLFGSQDEKSCTVCHTASSCRECHQVTQPDSHNNLWRLKTHGMQAAWNRLKCMVCHEEDSCTVCHQETRPQSHNAGWKDSHCYKCHTSKERGTGCALCHEGTIDTHPNPHKAGWRSQHCNSCHPGSPEARQCEVCHGGGGLANHPNPHSAGWRTEHCNTCHTGSPEAQQCAMCHGTAGHSNPHPAGWVNQHCNQCHDGPEAQKCAQCHEGVTSMATHPNPHSVGWRDKHCFACHEGSTANECAKCHPGGGSAQIHASFWPPVHNRFGSGANCYYCHRP